MATFGKLTDYFNRRKSREELHVGRSSRRSGSYCCTVAEARSLERKLQRPILAKSRTLPSIPQSPRVSRVQRSDLMGGSPPRRKNPPAAGSPKARTLPPAGEMWRLEDDNMEGEDEPEPGGARPRSQSPFSHLRARAAYLRKSISADNHLDMNCDDSSGTAPEDKPARGSKAKLKRKFSLGSVDRKENPHKKSESGISKFTHRLSLKERPAKAEKTASEGCVHSYRRRSLSVDWADSSEMTQPTGGEQGRQPTLARKSASLSSPSAARRLYRNLSGKFRVSTNPSSCAAAASEDGVPSERAADKERLRKSAVSQSNEALFEAVEHQQSDLVQLLLSQYSSEELDLNTPNSEGLQPLDIAVMTNDVPMAKLLLRAGAKESPHFVSSAGRALHLATLAQEAEQRVSELRSQVRGAGPGELEAAQQQQQQQLKAWEWRLRLFRRMLTGFRHAKPPDTPGAARLSVGGSSSLTLDFQEPRCVDSAVVTKYKVSWSTTPSFSCVLGEAVLEDTAALRYDITGLTSGTRYFVRVSAYNMKGWGPALASTPASAAPSSWRDADGRAPRQRGPKEALDRLLAQIKDGHQSCVCHEQCKAPAQGRKHSVSKSLRHLFQPSSKFVKSLKRGLYLASILYRDDSVLVTPEDQIPVVEVEDSYPSSLMQDFLWFTKVSFLWEEIPRLQQRVNPALAACSCTLQTRAKMLQAVGHLQGALGRRDLGQVYFEPIKDKHGNALLVLLKDAEASPDPDGARWARLCKLQLQRKSLSSPEEPSALDALLITLHEKLAYHRRSRKLLSPGLYLGYLKLCTSVEQIRALVPQKLPNVLCHTKIRDNHNVSREEWQWLQALGSSGEPMETDGPPPLLRELRSAIEDLTAHVNVPGEQAQGLRMYTREVLEFGDEVSFLLLLPPCDDVCTVPGQKDPYSPRCGFLTLPLQIFELVHFAAYRPALVGQYCRLSALLELESLLSQQALREAFSQDELAAAAGRRRRLQEHLQQTEEVWRDARWMVEALQYARDKQPTGGVSVGGLLDSSEEEMGDKRASDLAPSPTPSPSPQARRKHSDFAGLSDDEGSSEVFLATDSDYDSSRAQSPREPEPPASPRDRRGGRRGPPELFDSDFILPSRQIELLRVTEKRRAFCVRTSSLELPAPASAPRRPRSRRASSPGPPSAERGRRADRGPARRPPARTRSEDGGARRLASPRPAAPRGDGSRATLRVYPQYRTGLPKETSVQLCVTPRTSAGEVVRLVVQEMNLASRPTLGGDPDGGAFYGPEQMKHFGLVLVVDRREKWLRDDLCPLELQNPWLRGGVAHPQRAAVAESHPGSLVVQVRGAARMKSTALLKMPSSARRCHRRRQRESDQAARPPPRLARGRPPWTVLSLRPKRFDADLDAPVASRDTSRIWLSAAAGLVTSHRHDRTPLDAWFGSSLMSRGKVWPRSLGGEERTPARSKPAMLTVRELCPTKKESPRGRPLHVASLLR